MEILKIHKSIMFIAILLTACIPSNSLAQHTKMEQLEFAVEKLTAEMITQFKLSDEQTTEVKAINLKYLKKFEDIRSQTNGDRSAMQSFRASIQQDKNSEMKLVLTESQYKKYESMLVEINNGRGQRGKVLIVETNGTISRQED